MKQRTITVLASILVSALLLSACSSTGENTAQSPASEDNNTSAAQDADTPSTTETDANSTDGWVPEKDITFLVPFGAGDGLDLTSRALVEYADFPVNTIVENVSGGSGTIGVSEAYSRPADGSTITMLSVANALSQPLLNDTLSYTLEDWKPLQILCSPIIATLACNDSMGISTSEELKAFLESGKTFTVGVPSMNGFDYVAAITMFMQMGIQDNVTWVTYEGAANLYQGYLAGEVDFAAFDDMFAAKYVDAGDNVNVLLTIDSERSPFFPDLPCGAEWGIEGLEGNKCLWVAAVRSDTPQEICDYLTEKLNEAVLSEGYVKWSEDNYHAPYTDLYTSEEIMELLLIERDVYANVFRQAGLEVVDY